MSPPSKNNKNQHRDSESDLPVCQRRQGSRIPIKTTTPLPMKFPHPKNIDVQHSLLSRYAPLTKLELAIRSMYQKKPCPRGGKPPLVLGEPSS